MVVSSVSEYFNTLQDRFVAGSAAGVNAVIQYELSGEAGGGHIVHVEDGTCRYEPGTHEKPSATIKMKDTDFVAMVSGKLNGQMAFMTGKLKVTGNIPMMMKMQSIFPPAERAPVDRYRLWIDGAWAEASDGAVYTSVDPATEEAWAEVSAGGPADADLALAAAQRSFRAGSWRDKPPAERADILDRIALGVQERQDELVLAEVRDSGGTIRKGYTADITATAETFQYYAELIRRRAFEESEEDFVPVPATHIVRREPVGVVVAIVPFNFPLASAAWKVAPALAAGCSVVLKPSPLTPVTALLLGEIAHAAGVPAGVLNVVAGPSVALGQALVSDRRAGHVAFTGSTETGRSVMAACAQNLTRLTLELGGKSPNIVLRDAPLDTAVRGALFGTFFHQGQICESGTRVLVDRSIAEAFSEALVEGARALKPGNPLEFETTVGPLVSGAQWQRVDGRVQAGRAEGARCAVGGKRPAHLERGWFYEPTVFLGVHNDMHLAQEEIFGPVVCVIPFDSEEEALQLANESMFGLGAAVWSKDCDRALAMARRIESGTVWINDYHLLSPRFPFGGYKQSGFGRELGPQGLEIYEQIKHIHLGQPGTPEDKAYMTLLLEP